MRNNNVARLILNFPSRGSRTHALGLLKWQSLNLGRYYHHCIVVFKATKTTDFNRKISKCTNILLVDALTSTSQSTTINNHGDTNNTNNTNDTNATNITDTNNTNNTVKTRL